MALKILFVFLLLHNTYIGASNKAVTNGPGPDKPSRSLYGSKLTLGQNYPNPLHSTEVTAIPYSAIDATQASIILYDAKKKEKVLEIDDLPGETGEVKISGEQLAAGSYIYALVVNGRIVKKREMEVVK